MQSTIKSLFKSDKPDNAYYGFIVSSDTKKDYYFSAKDTGGLNFDDLKKGTIVEFEPIERADKRYANNVKLAQASSTTNSSVTPETEKAEETTMITDKISYRDYEKQVLESLNYI